MVRAQREDVPEATRESWWQRTAVECVDALRERRVSPRTLLDVAVDRVKATDGAINATPILCLDRAQQRIAEFEATGGAPGPLYGLPVLVKETQSLRGVRWTSGQPLHAHRMGGSTDPCIAAVEAAGGVVFGKTNVPEGAAGSHSFNPIFGTTANPFDTSLSAGGSTGGGAAALAVGQCWLATGSDLGGSLRQPAAFCGVCGLRPSYNLVPPRVPGAAPRPLNSVDGPMGRTVADVALLLDAMAGTAAAGGAGGAPPLGSYLAHALPRAAAAPPRRVGWCADMGGALRGVDAEVAAAVQRAAALLGAAAGAPVERLAPEGMGTPGCAEAVFRTLRADNFVAGVAGGRARAGEWLRRHAPVAKPEIVYAELRLDS